ncbi:MAG: hypothetical protein U0105_11500 [Candidatus Obscuribacterales bacterium]
MVSLHARTSLVLIALTLTLAPSMIATIPAADAAPQTAIDQRAPKTISTDQDLNQWLTYYYLHPQPDLVVPATLLAEKKGYLSSETGGPYMAFLSRIFAQNPTMVGDWLKQLDSIPARDKPMLWTAIYWSHTKESAAVLDQIAKSLPPKSQESLVEQIAKPPEPIEKVTISSPAVLDMLWGAFFATGDEKYVKRLISVLPWEAQNKDLIKMQVGASARWSLTSNAEQHAKVLEICQQVRETDPAMRTVLDPVIEKATKNLAAATATSKNR